MARESPARTITLSYPADLSDWGRGIVEGTPFRAYLRRAHDAAAVDDEWAEFVGVGCCGDTLDVPLRVEEVTVDRADDAEADEANDAEADEANDAEADGADDAEADGADDAEGGRIVASTTFAFEERAACGLAGGWAVQSESGG